jgi:hypothetical protein
MESIPFFAKFHLDDPQTSADEIEPTDRSTQAHQSKLEDGFPVAAGNAERICHPRLDRGSMKTWIPAFAGMTKVLVIPDLIGDPWRLSSPT